MKLKSFSKLILILLPIIFIFSHNKAKADTISFSTSYIDYNIQTNPGNYPAQYGLPVTINGYLSFSVYPSYADPYIGFYHSYYLSNVNLCTTWYGVTNCFHPGSLTYNGNFKMTISTLPSLYTGLQNGHEFTVGYPSGVTVASPSISDNSCIKFSSGGNASFYWNHGSNPWSNITVGQTYFVNNPLRFSFYGNNQGWMSCAGYGETPLSTLDLTATTSLWLDKAPTINPPQIFVK